MSFAAVLILALLIDAVAGEPEEIWGRVPHPAVLMGRAVGWCDDKLNAGKGRLMTGAVTIAALAGLAATLGWMLGQIGWHRPAQAGVADNYPLDGLAFAVRRDALTGGFNFR